MKEAFIEKDFSNTHMWVINQANAIIEEYRAQGFVLTLRQLYYQFVARDTFPDDRRWEWADGRWKRDPDGTKNAQPNYKWLAGIISDARLAGVVDWEAIEDRTRNLEKNWTFKSPKQAIQQIRKQYCIDMWANQDCRVEVWIEKEALTGIIEPVCTELDLPYFACRGYVSQSEQWVAGHRARARYNREDQHTIILHLGDHDPSGIDMTRDNRDRLKLFAGYRGKPTVERIALNMDQVEEFNPPPNPAKMTDPRAKEYIGIHGDESWELDALEPQFIDRLIRKHVDEWRDPGAWNEKVDQCAEEISVLDEIIASIEED